MLKTGTLEIAGTCIGTNPKRTSAHIVVRGFVCLLGLTMQVEVYILGV